MRNLKFICCQPATLYYAWQVEVLINNFLEMGVKPEQIDIICHREGAIPKEWLKLMSYPVTFHFYEDTRESKAYISSIRPNILKQHFAKFPELKDYAIFYHDCDIILTKPFDWVTDEMLTDDFWYGSNTDHYMDSNYILSKGQEIMDMMCRVMRIDESLVLENDKNTIGAQYLMKNVDSKFWEDVENDSEMLFVRVNNLSAQIRAKNPSYHELQIWCADMWALLWGAWRRGEKTIAHPSFDFSWASAPICKKDGVKDFESCNIMHNAGVLGGGEYFYKADYINKLPYDEELNLVEGASNEYFKWVKKVGKISKIK